MATTTWTGQNGNWTDATWTNGVPDASLDAIADGTSLDPITLNFDTPNGAAHSLNMAYATLAVSGGSLTLESVSSLDALSQSSGTLDFMAGGTIDGPVSQTGGTIGVNSGSLVIEHGGSFGGELSGSVGAGSSPEVVFAGGTSEWSGLTTSGSLTLDNRGTVDVDGLLTLGSSPSDQTTLINHREIDVVNGGGIAVNGTDKIFNSGIFEDSAPGTLSLTGDIVNSGGFVAVGLPSGKPNTIAFNQGTFIENHFGSVWADGGNVTFGPGMLDTALTNGTLTGDWLARDGTIALTGSPIVTLAGTIDIYGKGDKQYSNFQVGVITVDNGTSFTPLQDSLSTIAVGGSLELGPQLDIHPKRNLVDNGTFNLYGRVGLGTLWIGATGQLFVGPGGELAADSVRSAGTVSLYNTDLHAPLTSIGTLLVAGTVRLDGAENVLGGKIFGGGDLIFDSGTANTIEPGTQGNIDHVDLGSGASLTFKGDLLDNKGGFTAYSGSTIDLAGHSISFSNSSLFPLGDASAPVVVEGGGTLSDIGFMYLDGVQFTGGTELVATPFKGNLSELDQTGKVTLGDASGGTASVAIEAHATYTMEGTVAIDAADPAVDTVTNAGLLKKTGDGTATIGADFTNTGIIRVTQGTLEITGAFTNSGTIIGTESQSNGVTYITPPSTSVALFNQAVAAAPAAGTTNPVFAPAPTASVPTLAQPAV